jgi:hypothetical protein
VACAWKGKIPNEEVFQAFETFEVFRNQKETSIYSKAEIFIGSEDVIIPSFELKSEPTCCFKPANTVRKPTKEWHMV